MIGWMNEWDSKCIINLKQKQKHLTLVLPVKWAAWPSRFTEIWEVGRGHGCDHVPRQKDKRLQKRGNDKSASYMF